MIPASDEVMILKSERAKANKIKKEYFEVERRKFANLCKKDVDKVIQELIKHREPEEKLKIEFLKGFYKRFGRLPTDEEHFEYIKLFVMSEREDITIIREVKNGT